MKGFEFWWTFRPMKENIFIYWKDLLFPSMVFVSFSRQSFSWNRGFSQNPCHIPSSFLRSLKCWKALKYLLDCGRFYETRKPSFILSSFRILKHFTGFVKCVSFILANAWRFLRQNRRFIRVSEREDGKLIRHNRCRGDVPYSSAGSQTAELIREKYTERTASDHQFNLNNTDFHSCGWLNASCTVSRQTQRSELNSVSNEKCFSEEIE